jgi:hypothetical protein
VRVARIRGSALEQLALIGAIAFFGLFVAQWSMFLTGGGTGNIGVDYDLYMDATASWLAGDGFYLPRQLAGPYVITHGDVLYPPPFLVLLVPFQVLPAVLWYAIPLGITVVVVVRHRPTAPAWLAIAACLWFPITGVKILHGNPGIWFMAAIALGTLWAWPAALVLLKPTVLPFALVHVRWRAWWIGLGGLILVSLLFLPMWPDYITVLRNASSPNGIFYSLNEYPMLAIPGIAWLGGLRRRPILPRLDQDL